MISAKPLPPFVAGMLVCLGWLAWSVALGANQGCGARIAGHRYGPTTPGGYYVRVEPRAVTMAHNQRPQLTVAVEDAAGQPVEDVLVMFTPSEGTFTTGSSRHAAGPWWGPLLWIQAATVRAPHFWLPPLKTWQ